MTSELDVSSTPDWAGATEAYRAADRTVSEILAEFGVDRTRFYDHLHRQGIPLRGPRRRAPLMRPPVRERIEQRAGAAPTSLDVGGFADVIAEPAGPADIPSLAARMARLVSQNVRLLERSLSSGRIDDPERAARTLSLHARMLAGLDKLRTGKDEDAAADDIDPPPRSLAELRDELRRHLERIREEERSRSLPPDPDAD